VIRVLIVDDHPMVRRGLVELIHECEDMKLVGEADGYAAVTKALREGEIDVMLLDVDMPGKNGIEVLKVVKQAHPKVHVLMFSMYPEEQYAVRALKAGASGYLTKSTSPQDVLEAIRNAARGKKYITPELAQTLAEHVSDEKRDGTRLPHEYLSDREFQTLRLIAAGKKLSEIAAELVLSPKTVSVYRSRVLEKMNARNNADLTRYAMQHKLLE
jgi:DNA-binding NarL/FixJ family response regulator